MSEFHEGGRFCGSVRKGQPARVPVCHCTHCQRRTGGAFAVVAHFKGENLEISGGQLSTYEYRSDESHRWIRAYPRFPGCYPPGIPFEKGSMR
jgi:hypothetical protein